MWGEEVRDGTPTNASRKKLFASLTVFSAPGMAKLLNAELLFSKIRLILSTTHTNLTYAVKCWHTVPHKSSMEVGFSISQYHNMLSVSSLSPLIDGYIKTIQTDIKQRPICGAFIHLFSRFRLTYFSLQHISRVRKFFQIKKTKQKTTRKTPNQTTFCPHKNIAVRRSWIWSKPATKSKPNQVSSKLYAFFVLPLA